MTQLLLRLSRCASSKKSDPDLQRSLENFSFDFDLSKPKQTTTTGEGINTSRKLSLSFFLFFSLPVPSGARSGIVIAPPGPAQGKPQIERRGRSLGPESIELVLLGALAQEGAGRSGRGAGRAGRRNGLKRRRSFARVACVFGLFAYNCAFADWMKLFFRSQTPAGGEKKNGSRADKPTPPGAAPSARQQHQIANGATPCRR